MVYFMRRLLKAILGFNAISLVRLADSPREFWNACGRAFLAARNRELKKLPTVELGEILCERRVVIQLSVRRYEDGMLPSDQAMALLSVLVAENPREVLEIGTFMGHTTKQMAENLPAAKIHTVDLPETFSPESDAPSHLPKDDLHLIKRRIVGREFKDQPCRQILQHFADTATWDFHEAGSPTFFFIDGSHTYEHCRHDSEQCFALCEGRGVFLWHDCDETHPGVIQFVQEWRELGRDIKVISGTPLAYWKSTVG